MSSDIDDSCSVEAPENVDVSGEFEAFGGSKAFWGDDVPRDANVSPESDGEES